MCRIALKGTFTQWMEGVHDWVISRQLWWGHQIPTWYNKRPVKPMLVKRLLKILRIGTRTKDVLDTWFSSALWPFSTMGWPNTDAEDYKRYFPTDTLVTGYDIIFFWVSRMIFQSLEFTEKRPFKHVLLHGLIRDEQGRKMSKSLGNGIDPMDVIDKYGADALRWFLSNGSTPGQDVRFSYTKMDSAWNFINKIWNASRFVIMNLGDVKKPSLPNQSEWNLADKWILNQLNETVEQVTDKFDKFNFGEAGRALYDFIWNDFCDWYIEMSKEILNGNDEKAKANTQNVLAYVLDQTLKLLHPIMPFVTEKIWLSMPHEGKSLVTAEYPVTHTEFKNAQASDDMASLIELIKAVRNIRAEANAPMATPIDLLIKTSDKNVERILTENQDYIERLHIKAAKLRKRGGFKLSMTGIILNAEIYVPLEELVDLDDEAKRLEKEIAKFESEVKRAKGKLANERFVSNAPDSVVEAERQKQTDNEAKLQATKDRLADLKN